LRFRFVQKLLMVFKKESYILKRKENGFVGQDHNSRDYQNKKYVHRMLIQYLKGKVGDQLITILAAAKYNVMMWMRLKRQEILDLIIKWIYQAFIFIPINIKCKRHIIKMDS
jgi:hypothetical protein